MTSLSVRISERRTGIIHIYINMDASHLRVKFLFFCLLPFVSFFFRLQEKTAILTHKPSLFSFFLFLDRKNSIQLEQYIKSIKQSLLFYCVFLTALHTSPQFPAYNFVVFFFFSFNFFFLILYFNKTIASFSLLEFIIHQADKTCIMFLK